MVQAIGLRGGAAEEQVELLELPVPQLDADEVLVQMYAVGLGSAAAHGRPGGAAGSGPVALGRSGAGVIKEVGGGVTEYAVGDAVFFTNPVMAKGGAWAQYAAVPAAQLVRKPDRLSFTDAATLPDAAEFAAESMARLQLRRNRLALVADAASATGSLLVQMAAREHCWVLAVAHPRHHNYLRSIGAQAVFSSTDAEWAQRVREFAMQGVHGAFALGADADCLATVRDGGSFVTLSGEALADERGIKVERLGEDFPARDHLAAAAATMADKQLRATVDRIFPWHQALAAVERAATPEIRGTTVLTIHAE